MNTATQTEIQAPTIVALPQPRRTQPTYREPFKIVAFENPRTGTQSWRVNGFKRDGSRVRENFSDLKAAECRKIALTTEWLAKETEMAVRATKLTESQIRLAELAFMRLPAEEELTLAVDRWLEGGRDIQTRESPRIDDAYKSFCDWLDNSPLRDRTQDNLRLRVKIFRDSIGNLRVADITPDVVFNYLEKRNIAGSSKDNDRRALSRFFAWCIVRPQQWITTNPARKETRDRKSTNGTVPSVLTIAQCKALLRAAESKGLAPYVSVSLFAGLRPSEALRLTWQSVNLKDREIRLEGTQTKTGTPRVVPISKTLLAWLKAYKDQPFFPSNWRKDFDAVKQAVGFGTMDDEHPDRQPWPVDVMRHTAISHYFRKTGSYGETAEWAGNSEAIIKRHYQGRVSTDDTKRFYALRPQKLKRK